MVIMMIMMIMIVMTNDNHDDHDDHDDHECKGETGTGSMFCRSLSWKSTSQRQQLTVYSRLPKEHSWTSVRRINSHFDISLNQCVNVREFAEWSWGATEKPWEWVSILGKGLDPWVSVVVYHHYADHCYHCHHGSWSLVNKYLALINYYHSHNHHPLNLKSSLPPLSAGFWVLQGRWQLWRREKEGTRWLHPLSWKTDEPGIIGDDLADGDNLDCDYDYNDYDACWLHSLTWQTYEPDNVGQKNDYELNADAEDDAGDAEDGGDP